MPVELNGQRLCQVADVGGVRYQKEDIADDTRSIALDKVIDIAKATAEYMSQMEAAPQLKASGLEGDYRLLVDFNGVVLAGHPTKYGVQFVSWERSPDQTSLGHGHYYGPNSGIDSYTAAKQDFAVRSGLIPHSTLFAPEQLVEIYHCCTEVLAGLYSIEVEQRKCLQSIIEQIECNVPDLGERLQREWEAEVSEAPEDSGMQFW